MTAVTIPNSLTDAAVAAGNLFRSAHIINRRLGILTMPSVPAPQPEDIDRILERIVMCQEALDSVSRELTYYLGDSPMPTPADNPVGG